MHQDLHLQDLTEEERKLSFRSTVIIGRYASQRLCNSFKAGLILRVYSKLELLKPCAAS
jgi:hypothetical protein